MTLPTAGRNDCSCAILYDGIARCNAFDDGSGGLEPGAMRWGGALLRDTPELNEPRAVWLWTESHNVAGI
jgi:hypothetical protein